MYAICTRQSILPGKELPKDRLLITVKVGPVVLSPPQQERTGKVPNR